MIALEADLGTILGPFWAPKSLQNRSKIGSETSQNSCSFLIAILDLQKSIFRQHDPNLAPKWPPNGLPKTSFLEVFGSPRGTWNAPKYQQQLHSSFEPILDRFWADFGPIWDRFWTDFGPILDRFGADFERCLDRFLDDVSSICCLLYVVCCVLSVVCYLWFVVGCLLFFWCPLLLCYLLLVVFYCLLIAVCCLSCSFVFCSLAVCC